MRRTHPQPRGPRLLVTVLILLLLLAGGIYFLSTLAKPVPTSLVESDVAPVSNAE
jgi:hypothetical protein